MCKLYIIEKNKIWYGVLTTPEGSCRFSNKVKGNVISIGKALAREVYKLKVQIIELEAMNEIQKE